MRAKLVKESIGDNYLNNLYREKDQLLQDLDEEGKKGENTMPTIQALKHIEQEIETEELEQQEYREYEMQQRGENPYN